MCDRSGNHPLLVPAVCVWYWETVTVLLWSDWKDFFLLLFVCCLVSWKRGCSNLHRFACWLMLRLWEGCAWCEVNSCAFTVSLHTFLFPLFQRVFPLLYYWAEVGQSSLAGCDIITLLCEKLSIQSRRDTSGIIKISKEHEQCYASDGKSEEVICCQEITLHQLLLNKRVEMRLYSSALSAISLCKSKTKAQESFSISAFSLIA